MIDFFGFNLIDVIFLALLLYFLLTNSGFISSAVEIIGLLLTSLICFKLYPSLTPYLVNMLGTSKGIANALSFITIWISTEIIFFVAIHFLLKKIPHSLYKSRINYVLGILPAILQACIFYAFIVTSLVALPVRGNLKKEVLSSKTAPPFVEASQTFESSLRAVFNDAIAEGLNFITIKPQSDERIDLGFTLKENELKVDESSEVQMIALVNQERAKNGLKELKPNNDLRNAAREYAKTMFKYGFFSHESLYDHTTPAQRLDNKGIPYMIMGENLAFAPDVNIAHNGLMNSPGHRANILSVDFGQIGIGIIDGGIYGRMFVQEFTN